MRKCSQKGEELEKECYANMTTWKAKGIYSEGKREPGRVLNRVVI